MPSFKNAFSLLQKIGKCMMLPVSVLPVAGILLGVGSANFSFLPAIVSQVMAAAGNAIFANLPKIFRRIRETADAVVAANPDVLVIIDSPEIAKAIAARFEAIARPANSYRLSLESATGTAKGLRWTTEIDGKQTTFADDPDVEMGKRALIQMLSLLPIDNLL